jgi:cytidylate kinase
VVTISRQAGAGAETVAQLVVERLNHGRKAGGDTPWTVFNKNLVERVIEDHQLPLQIQKFMPEDATVFSPGGALEEMLGLHPSSWTLAHHTTDTIYRLARLGNVVLVGRGANFITAELPKALHVRLVAPLALRVKRVAAVMELSEADAAELVRERDHGRERYVKVHFKAAIDDPLRYHMVLNTGCLSFEHCAKLIAETAREL